MITRVPKAPRPGTAGDLQQVVDEPVRQRGRLHLRRGVTVQAIGVRVRMLVHLLQPGEQMPQITLAGVRATLAMRGMVGSEEPVEQRGVAGGEVPLLSLLGHPPVQDTGGLGISRHRVLLKRPVLPVRARPQPLPELPDHQPPQIRARQARPRPQTRMLTRGCQNGHARQASGPQRALTCRLLPATAEVLLVMGNSPPGGARHTPRQGSYVPSTEKLTGSTWAPGSLARVFPAQRQFCAPSVIRTRDLLLRRHIGLNAMLTCEDAGQQRAKARKAVVL